MHKCLGTQVVLQKWDKWSILKIILSFVLVCYYQGCDQHISLYFQKSVNILNSETGIWQGDEEVWLYKLYYNLQMLNQNNSYSEIILAIMFMLFYVNNLSFRLGLALWVIQMWENHLWLIGCLNEECVKLLLGLVSPEHSSNVFAWVFCN